MNSLILIGLAVLVAWFQSGVLNQFRVLWVKADLLFLLGISVSLFFPYSPGWVLSFALICGLLKDIFMPGAMGVNVMLFPCFCFIVAMASRKFAVQDGYVRLIAIGAAVLFYNICINILMAANGLKVSWPVFFKIVIVSTILTTAVFPVLFYYILKHFLPQER